MKGPWGLLLLTLLAAPASAGALYRCVGADGVPSYGNRKEAGARCETVGNYTPRRLATLKPNGPVAAKTPAPVKAAEDAPRSAVAPVAVAAPVASMAARPDTTRRVVSGQVFSYMKDGVRHFTSARPQGVARVEGLRTIRYSYIETCYACALNPTVNFGTLRLNTVSYQSEIAAAAREFGVDEAVVRAIIHAESAYNPTALSRAGAQGLMQLMPGTAARFGVGNVFDAQQNIRGGVQYLSWLLKRFNGNLSLAAAGYNAGEGAVDKYGGVPPYSETQRYVQRVGVLADRYRGAMQAR